MDQTDYAGIAHVMELNRVRRAYTGGRLLDEWQGLKPALDGNCSEEFMISTVEVTNEKKEEEEGLSKTLLPDGTKVTLKELIGRDYKRYLGESYAKEKDVGVSVRVGDTTVRHVLQCHPDTEYARRELGFPNGKSEAWYIIETRCMDEEEPYLYVGFKRGVTRTRWKKYFDEQNIPAMLECMHKIPVQKGGVYYVEAGMPHCLGPGIMFVEIHEPCDYTFRMEKNYLGNRIFADAEMHYGLGFEKMLDAFHYDTYTEEEIRRLCVLQSELLSDTGDLCAQRLVSCRQAKGFMVEKYTLSGEAKLPEFDGHRIAVTLKGGCGFEANGCEVKAKQGRGIFLPSNMGAITLRPHEADTQVLICYPPDRGIVPDEVFQNPIQVGILVRDLDACLDKLTNVFGMGPFRIADYPPKGEQTYREYHGTCGDFTAKFCFCHLGNIELELIQPISGENIWDDFINKYGSGLHHLKFLVSDPEAVEAYMRAHGYPVSQRGEAVGPNRGRVWSFYPTYEEIGFDVEIMNES